SPPSNCLDAVAAVAGPGLLEKHWNHAARLASGPESVMMGVSSALDEVRRRPSRVVILEGPFYCARFCPCGLAIRSLVTMAQETGTVKWFDARKGYGFIERDNGDDIFVHINDMADAGARALEDGERVTFDVGQGRKGPAAQNVSRI